MQKSLLIAICCAFIFAKSADSFLTFTMIAKYDKKVQSHWPVLNQVLFSGSPAIANKNLLRPNILSMSGPSYVLDSFDPEDDEISDELSNENLLRIIKGDVPDNEVNLLVWKCLGYEQVDGVWSSEKVVPKWRAKYPSPPDVIGARVM